MVNYEFKKGFTLIELIVAISIIAILASFLTANFIGARQRARDAQRKSDLRQIQAALELSRSDRGFYPTSEPTGGEFGTGATNCIPPVAFTLGGTEYMKAKPCEELEGQQYFYTAQPANCNNGLSLCTGYVMYACLENKNDIDREFDDGNGSDRCGGSTADNRVGFVVTNP